VNHNKEKGVIQSSIIKQGIKLIVKAI